MPHHSKPDRTHEDEKEANTCGFPGPIPEETEQRIQEKYESGQGCEQYQGEEMIRVTIFN